MKSDGKAKRAFCYLSDATIGFFTVLINGENAQAYNITNPKEEYSILELAEKIVSTHISLQLQVVKVIESEKNNYIKSPIFRNSGNIDKAIKLGWMPNVNIETGFIRTVESFL
jgi:nucleoside-diphosphate-sugar epimerase